MDILIATHNPGKLKEIKGILSDINKLKILSLNDLNIAQDVKEDGKTYEENSKKKAKFYARLAKMPTIADDGGLEIDALGGAPGIKSRRWLGYKMTDQELIDTILSKMKDIPDKKRTCRFRTISTFYDPDKNDIKQFEGQLECVVANRATDMLDPGYPFRSVLVEPVTKKYLIDFEKEENFLSHRAKSLNKIKKYLKKNYNIN